MKISIYSLIIMPSHLDMSSPYRGTYLGCSEQVNNEANYKHCLNNQSIDRKFCFEYVQQHTNRVLRRLTEQEEKSNLSFKNCF
jgi:hypothetical protein